MRETGQSLIVTDKVIKVKRGLNFINRNINGVTQDDNRRKCSSPPRAKNARLEGSVTSSGSCTTKAENEDRYGCFEIYSRKDYGKDVKPETLDGLGIGCGHEELAFCENDILSASNNSVTSTRACLPQSNSCGSTKSTLALLSPNAEYGGTHLSVCKSEPQHISTPTEEGYIPDQPDSSTISAHRSKREHEQLYRKSNMVAADIQASTGLIATSSVSKGETLLCQVCEDLVAGFYCGAYICEACKKFFIRSSKLGQPRFVCLRSKTCMITRESRVHCQHCRYQKCLQLNMYYPKGGQKNGGTMGVQDIPCRVCSAPSSGFHFGAITCEGCKGFFRRMVKERDSYSYKCSRNGACEINAITRNMCKSCRYNKCLHIGMSVEGSRIGRQPNAVKHAISIEARKQTALKIEPGSDIRPADSSPFRLTVDSFGLDPCLPEELDDGHQSMIEISPSVHAHKNEFREMDVMKPEPHLSPQEHHLSTQEHHLSPQEPHLSPQEHHLSTQEHHLSPQEHHVSTQEHHLSIQEHHLSTQEHHLSTQEHHLSPQEHHLSPQEHHLSTQENNLSPQEPHLSTQEHHLLTRGDHHDLLEFPVPHPEIIRHHLPPPEYDEHTHNVYSSSSSLLSLSTNIPSDINPKMFERAENKTFDLLSVGEAEDLSIDLSSLRTSNTCTGQLYPQSITSTSNIAHFSSSSSIHPSTPPPGSVCLSSASPPQPVSPHYYPIDYTCRGQQNSTCTYFINNFIDRNQNCRLGYQHSEKYDSHNIYYSDTRKEEHMLQQETYLSMLYSQNAQSQILGSNFSSPFHNGNRSLNDIPNEQQIPQLHLIGSQPLHQPQILLFRHNPRDIHAAEHQPYASQIEKLDSNMNDRTVNSLPERPCLSPPSHSHNLSQPVAPWQPNKFSPSHALPHSLPHSLPQYSGALEAPYPSDPIHSPASSQSTNIPEPLNTAAVTVTTTRNHYDMAVPTEELHVILLDAARNLAHFCAVNRAKSDVYDPDRFKDVDSTWEKMMEHFNFHAKCIVRFAKRLPGFRSLKIDDQVLLLRMATYSLVILNHSRVYEPETGFYNYFNFTQREIHMIRDLFPEFDVIHTHYKHIGIMVQRQGLTEVEYAYMSCVLLLNSEYPGLENSEMTKSLKERYMNAFLDYEIEHFPKGRLRFAEMLLHLSEFTQLNMQHSIAVRLVITKNPQLHIPQLYAEMYTNNDSVLDSSDSTNGDATPDVCELHEPPAVAVVK